MSANLDGGSIRILWDASDSAEVTITGGAASFTVNGSPVTFPYTLSSSTTFVTDRPGVYEVSVLHHGYEIADTPDSTRTVELRFGGQDIFAPSPDGTPSSEFLADLHEGLSATYGRPLSSSLDDAAFDALLASLDPGARVFIPEGVTVSLGAGHTLTQPVTIDGPGRILDTRAVPTTALFTLGPAASGSKITCPVDGSVAGQYIEAHNAFYIVGTDNGAGVAATPVTDITIDTPRISGFGRYAVRGSWVADSTITIDEASNLGHGGVVIQSAEDVSVLIRRLHDLGPGLTGQTYGIDFDRKDNASDLVRYPRSTNCSGTIDVTYDSPGVFLLGSHGGNNLNFVFGSAYGIARAINIGPGELDSGDDHLAPSNIAFRGGYASSGVTDGSGDSAVVIAGGFNVGTSTVVEYATGISGHIDVLKGFGDEADSIGGAVYCRTTQGLSLSFGTIQEPSPRAINLYHTNKDYSVSVGAVIDAWSNTLADADLINHTGSDNTGIITTLRGSRGAKTATKVNTRGVVAASSTNKVKLGAATDMTACTTKVSGYVSGLTHWSAVASQMAWVLDGTLQALFYADGLLMTNGQKIIAGASTTSRASLQIQAGTAPTTPSSGDVWSTSQGVFIRLAGATRQMFSGFTASATLDFPSVAAGGSQELTVTVTGAAAGDVVSLSAPAAIEAGLVWNGYVSAADTVKVRVTNVTAAAIDPASASWRATVLRAA